MNILHLISSLKIGGAEAALFNFLQKQNKTDVHVVAYFHDGPYAKMLRRFGIRTYHIRGIMYKYDPIALFRLVRFVKHVQPDVIHTALPAANIIGRLLAKYFRIPLIGDVHGDVRDHGLIRTMLERYTLSIPVRLISVSHSVKAAFLSHIVAKCSKKRQCATLNKKLVVIQNGIDSVALHNRAATNPLLRSDIGFSDDDFVVGSVGRLEAIKLYDELIVASKILMDDLGCRGYSALLCLVGDGSQRKDLEWLTQKLGISNRVHFMGHRDDAYRFYSLFDCFVLSSRSEGLSIALLEALTFGLPVISTSKELKHDVICDGVNGFLIKPHKVRALSHAMQRLFQDKALAASMSEANKQLVKEKFDIMRVVDSYTRLYHEVTQKKV